MPRGVGRLKLLATAATLSCLAAAAPAAAGTHSNTNPIAPLDGGQVAAAVTASGETGTVAKVRVTLDQAGTMAPADLDVLLVGPAGQRAIVVSDACGSGTFVNATISFDDAAGGKLANSCGTGLSGGTFQPTDEEVGDVFQAPAPSGPHPATLSGFVGAQPNGVWTLYVADDGFNFNSLAFIGNGWRLDLTTTPAATPDATAAAKKCPIGKKLKKGKCKKKKRKKRGK